VRLRTLQQLDDAVDRETAWRKRELTTLLFNVREARASKQQVSLRAGVAMLYAHWEGWIKAVGRLYVEFVDQQGLRHEELAPPFLGNALKTRLSGVAEANAAWVHTDFAAFLTDGGLGTKANLSTLLVRTESNLSSAVLRDITIRLGVPFDPYELLVVLIDERLVAIRNAVAHGEYLDMDEEQFEDLYQKVLTMLNRFTNDVRTNAAARRYRR
jgi:hypothetical protein